jgi:hypothetical protein
MFRFHKNAHALKKNEGMSHKFIIYSSVSIVPPLSDLTATSHVKKSALTTTGRMAAKKKED